MDDIEQLRINDYHVFRWIYYDVPLPTEIFEEVRTGLYSLVRTLINLEIASVSLPSYRDYNNRIQEAPIYNWHVNPSSPFYLMAPAHHQVSFIPQLQSGLTGYSQSWGVSCQFQEMNHSRLAEADMISSGPLNYTQRVVDLDLHVEWNTSSPSSDVFSPQSYCESVATPAPRSGGEFNEMSSHSMDDNFGHFYEDSGTPNNRPESGFGNIRVKTMSELGQLPRMRVPDNAKDILQRAFSENNHLKSDRRELLAEETNLTPRQVQVWFQNARKRKKSSEKAANKHSQL